VKRTSFEDPHYVVFFQLTATYFPLKSHPVLKHPKSMLILYCERRGFTPSQSSE